MPSLRLLLHPYYWSNLLVLAAYFWVRNAIQSPYLESPDRFLGMTREQEIACIAFVGAANRSRKLPTLEAILGHFVLFFRTAIVVLLYFRDRRIMVWAAIIFALAYFLLPPPSPTSHEDVVELTRSMHEELIEREAKTGNIWIVFYYKPWSTRSNELRRVFAEVAATYTIPGVLRFGVSDVSARLSERLTINCSGLSLQLPTLILYDGTMEVKRLPPIRDGKVVKTLIDKAGIQAYFALDRRFAEIVKREKGN